MSETSAGTKKGIRCKPELEGNAFTFNYLLAHTLPDAP